MLNYLKLCFNRVLMTQGKRVCVCVCVCVCVEVWKCVTERDAGQATVG